MTFDELSSQASAGHSPHDWQRKLAEDTECLNRTIRAPTGFGKTLGVLGTWLWHRVERNDEGWPRRLVWCLPMRVLAEQTESEVRQALSRVGLPWRGEGDRRGRVGVNVIMGGADAGDWHLYPEERVVLIGTQDMLLSRALNRGYAAPRARWPMELGLLSQDCLWVMDEVQLMDVGLSTSAQLQAFRDDDRERRCGLGPQATWWMSATLQPSWLAKSPATARMVSRLEATRIEPGQRCGHLWGDVRRPLRTVAAKNAKAVARLTSETHRAGDCGAKGPTLVVVNRVETVIDVWEALRTDKSLAGTDIRLVHSRFRPRDREPWSDEFLNRGACLPGTDRILVATQVVEAGVDYSAAAFVTELAPWASLVQRFGRCARWGGEAEVIVVDFGPKDDKAAAPYSIAELDAARAALAALDEFLSKESDSGQSSSGVAPLRSLRRSDRQLAAVRFRPQAVAALMIGPQCQWSPARGHHLADLDPTGGESPSSTLGLWRPGLKGKEPITRFPVSRSSTGSRFEPVGGIRSPAGLSLRIRRASRWNKKPEKEPRWL
jgi:CRISPR-associated endonuclease/helicase Cas3